MVQAMIWKGNRLDLIDQRYLPFEKTYFNCDTPEDIVEGIREMVVRGAPAIGVTAAYGLVLALQQNPTAEGFEEAAEKIAGARPTAVNLFDAIAYIRRGLGSFEALTNPAKKAEELAVAYHEADLAMSKAMGRHGAAFLSGHRNVLTHCNTGSLATAGWGTALGVARQLHQEGRLDMLYADETRPFLQGARLTVWECKEDGLPVKLVTDGMGGYLMTQGLVDCVVVGSDRITALGDVTNKIGTFMLAMAAKYHGIPFVVAAPTTTIDRQTDHGKDVPIEHRDPKEVTQVREKGITAEGTEVMNPAFDVTPSELVTAIVTEEGVFQYPYDFRQS